MFISMHKHLCALLFELVDINVTTASGNTLIFFAINDRDLASAPCCSISRNNNVLTNKSDDNINTVYKSDYIEVLVDNFVFFPFLSFFCFFFAFSSSDFNFDVDVRLIVRSDFGSNIRNRSDLTVLALEIDLKPDLVSTIFGIDPIRFKSDFDFKFRNRIELPRTSRILK
jgi:hypothetical protein